MPTSIYRIDPDGLRRACNYLGLEADVKLLIRKTKALGRYVAWRDGVHIISLNSRMTPGDADLVVWHELTHARQVERCGSHMLFDALWQRQMVKAGFAENRFDRATELDQDEFELYTQAPFEREADENALTHPRNIQVVRMR
jgi:hypothetical protein